MTIEEQSLLLRTIMRNQMALMMGLAELMDGLMPWAGRGARAEETLRSLHEQTCQLIETLKP
jgi:hypothetical protein